MSFFVTEPKNSSVHDLTSYGLTKRILICIVDEEKVALALVHEQGPMSSTAVGLFTTARGTFKSPNCLLWMQELIGQCATLGIHYSSPNVVQYH